MRYPIAVEAGTDQQSFGVVVPDLPGCFAAGDTMDEALADAEAAALAWIDAMLDRSQPIPAPSTITDLRQAHPEYADWVWAIATVDPARLDDTVERVNITLPRRILARLDASARAVGETRSGYIARLALFRR